MSQALTRRAVVTAAIVAAALPALACDHLDAELLSLREPLTARGAPTRPR